jgi:hypothetical protein
MYYFLLLVVYKNGENVTIISYRSYNSDSQKPSLKPPKTSNCSKTTQLATQQNAIFCYSNKHLALQQHKILLLKYKTIYIYSSLVSANFQLSIIPLK